MKTVKIISSDNRNVKNELNVLTRVSVLHVNRESGEKKIGNDCFRHVKKMV